MIYITSIQSHRRNKFPKIWYFAITNILYLTGFHEPITNTQQVVSSSSWPFSWLTIRSLTQSRFHWNGWLGYFKEPLPLFEVDDPTPIVYPLPPFINTGLNSWKGAQSDRLTPDDVINPLSNCHSRTICTQNFHVLYYPPTSRKTQLADSVSLLWLRV